LDIRNKHISVIGAARSGIAVSRLAALQGATVFVSDSGSYASLEDAAQRLSAAGIAYEFGSHSEKVCECDVMIISPGVPSTSSIVMQAQERGIPVVSEIEAASWFYNGTIIAVTGSNGKTTTTALIGKIFEAANKSSVVAGNIGYAFSDAMLDSQNYDYAILEVSSFQLDHIQSFKPDIAVITNISPDHLDRYANRYENYINAKLRIYENQTETDTLIWNYDDPDSVANIDSKNADAITCSLTDDTCNGYLKDGAAYIRYPSADTQVIVKDTSALKMKGVHNVMNALMASAVSIAAGIEASTISSVIESFPGVEHRLEFVRTLKQRNWYNDSKATNVESTLIALRSLDKPIILIAGGRDKGASYEPLRNEIIKKVSKIIILGESADLIAESLAGSTEIHRVNSLEEAVSHAHSTALAGDNILLSPACSSFDMFANYEQRGETFKLLVEELPA
jgi:UDP-N-acetylmuramoylalanine--D-glutamate ligase